jgi:diguanylate cyclase (GGDEF)-like protein
MFSHFITMLKKDYKLKKDYFQIAEDHIAQKNLELLKLTSLIFSVSLVFFCTAILLIFKNWSVIPVSLLFLLSAVIFFVVSFKYLKSGHKDKRTITALCLLFEATVFAFAAIMDLSPRLNVGVVFLPLFYITFSICFIFPLWQIISVQLIVEIIYIISIMLMNNPYTDKINIPTSIVSLILSFLAGHIRLKSQAEDYNVRMQYRYLSMTDSLTGILNKKACEDAIREYLDTTANCYGALLFLDLDNFKNVNDYIGHTAGDQILEETGKLLVESFRSTDIVGRVGGDEFMILIKDFHDSEAVLKRKCTMLQYDMCQTMLRFSVESSCSIGVVLFQNTNIEFQDIYKMADISLHRAKRSGKNQYVIYNINEEK